MSSASVPREGGEVASPAHTAALLSVILAVAITGSALQRYAPATPPPRTLPRGASRILTQYLPLLAVNAGLVLYVSRLFRARSVLADLIGQGWHSARRVAIDLALAVGSALLIQIVEASRLFSGNPLGRNAALSMLLPSTGAERLSWVFVGSCVGFCEEVVYRGYLQRQFFAFSGRAVVAIALQAILFGVAHLEQGAPAALRIGGYGLLLGLLAHYRRSLLPGIACHVGINVASAFLR